MIDRFSAGSKGCAIYTEFCASPGVAVTRGSVCHATGSPLPFVLGTVMLALLDKNDEKTRTQAYRTVTDLQNSGGDLQVVDKVGVPDGI